VSSGLTKTLVDGGCVMKVLLAVVIGLLATLVILQVRSSIVPPKWEYKIERLDGSLCMDLKGFTMPTEPELAKKGWLDNPSSKDAIMAARAEWATSIMTACFNWLGNEGWEIISIDAEHVSLKRSKP
jgi:hypothetical protein